MEAPRVAKREWNPEAMLADLTLETQFDGGDAPSTIARLLREYGPIAAQSIAHLSAYAGNERVRMQAAQYIVDRVLDGQFEHDLKMQKEQIALVGQALYAVVRALGMRFGFDPEMPEVKAIAHETILELATHGSDS